MSFKKLLGKALTISLAAMAGWMLGIYLDSTDPLLNAIGTWIGFVGVAILAIYLIWEERH